MSPRNALRPDLAVIAQHVAHDTRVLDVGCGDGELMAVLRDTKHVDARGMEIDPGEVEKAVARGLSVVQGDANRDLADYPDAAFDYAILSQTLQTAARPDLMLDELLRIGRKAFVSSGGKTSTVGEEGFALFLDPIQISDQAVSVFYLGFDDQVTGQDDDYDDLIIRGTYTGAIPEPGTWALLLLGFGAIGGLMRLQRKSRPALAAQAG